MNISGYLTEHWGMLVMLIGLSIVLKSDKHLEKRMIHRLVVAIVIIFIYSITCYIETYLGNQETYSVLRPVLSATNYSLVTFILVNIILIVYPEQKMYLLIPAILNAVLCFLSIQTGIVFTINKDNHFIRGDLGYLTYFVNGMYLAYMIINLFRNKRIQKEDYPLIIFLALTAILCLIMPLYMEQVALHWFIVTITIDLLLYYIYLLQQITKRDPLTNLLNRQSYYTDADKYFADITAIIAIDMDGLKEVNDNYGHVAGDVALKTLADCFWKAAHKDQRVYRIGGDEYTILCLNASEEDVKALILRIKQEVSKTEYACSVGYSMKTKDSTIDSLYQEADANMYVEKQKYYEISGKSRRRIRTNEA